MYESEMQFIAEMRMSGHHSTFEDSKVINSHGLSLITGEHLYFCATSTEVYTYSLAWSLVFNAAH